jgi:hypothetical protein
MIPTTCSILICLQGYFGYAELKQINSEYTLVQTISNKKYSCAKLDQIYWCSRYQ